MRRPSIRVRLALASAAAMALLLIAAGGFLYLRLATELSGSLDQTLRQRSQDLALLVQDGKPAPSLDVSGPFERGENFAQVYDSNGALLASSSSLEGLPLLGTGQLAQARRSAAIFERPSVPGLDEPARMMVTPVARRNRTVVLLVGATKGNEIETLAALRRDMVIFGPLALLAAFVGGYLLAGAALRPVETMRRRAELITAEAPGQRISVPAVHDELARLGETLNEMLGRLEAALNRERNFVADAGHELRTPLALLRTELELSLRHPRSDAELRAAIASAAQEAQRLGELAEALLLIAGGEQRRLPIRMETVPTIELLQSSARRFDSQLTQERRVLRTDWDDAPELEGDRSQLEQALNNLVHNALRHGAGDIGLFTRAVGEIVELHVIDEGPGFPSGYLSHAFERFSRPDLGRAGGGVGLGLSIAHAVAVAHAGSAHVENRPDGGAHVWLSIPRRQDLLT